MTTAGHPRVPPIVPVLDPRSESGRRAAREFGELVADVEDRLAREHAEQQIRTA